VDGSVAYEYAWDQRYIDAPVARFDAAGDAVYYTNDANMNVTSLVEESGTVIERYAYDPYGERTVLDADWSADADGLSDVDNVLGHQGLYLDTESALYYNRNRYYSPSLGRFITRDPLGYVDGMSVYEYVKSQAIVLTDHLGTFVDADGIAETYKELTDEVWALMRKKAGSKEYAKINAVDWLEMAKHVATRMSSSRYFWTTKGGWIDIKHFLMAAAHTNRWFVTKHMVVLEGGLIEERQARLGNKSAWGIEDLPSNLYGAEFDYPECNTDLPARLVRYIDDKLGGLAAGPKNDLAKMNYIRNFTASPILSLKDKRIKVHKPSGIPYVSHSDDVYTKNQLRTMAAKGISGRNYGNGNNDSSK
jgi:RHS repeat-associated protein